MGNTESNNIPNNNVELGVTPIRKTRSKLTLKQEGFVRDYLETKNASEAVRRNYDVKGAKPGVITNLASTNLAKPSIQEAITGLKQQYVEDSSNVYAIQKDILNRAKDHPKHWELANKIANKIQDRAGFAPTYKSESKSVHARFVVSRGDDTSINSDSKTSVIGDNELTEA
jgi:hypothetical protein